MTLPIFDCVKKNRSSLIQALFFYLALSFFSSSQAETLGPPTLGEQTKGKPAVEETRAITPETTEVEKQADANDTLSALGSATVIEHKRESGQVYLIELEHSFGAKQYLYENDSDGQIGSSIEDNESIKEIPKWKIGSW